MKRWKKIGVSILLVLLAMIVGLAVWQKENLKALYTYLTSDSETISENLENTQKEQQATLEKEYHITVKAPSAQQSEALLDGTMTPEEVMDSIGITQKTEKVSEQEAVQGPSASQAEQSPQDVPMVEAPVPEEAESAEEQREKQIEELVNQCVAELYACEVDLMARLGVMKQAAVDEWVALPEEERTTERKMEIGFAGLEQCYDLEVEVDKTVQGILSNYEIPLSDLGSDLAVLDELWEYYLEKKASQKAYYLDKYLD